MRATRKRFSALSRKPKEPVVYFDEVGPESKQLSLGRQLTIDLKKTFLKVAKT